jgi:hypothetical protein
MKSAFRIEIEVLRTIAQIQNIEIDIFEMWLSTACVTARENTGAGFYTTFQIEGPVLADVSSPLGDVWADAVSGLSHGMGFLLWLEDGCIHVLEGFAFGEDTSGIDFQTVDFVLVDEDRKQVSQRSLT